jgi:hypothetical protein
MVYGNGLRTSSEQAPRRGLGMKNANLSLIGATAGGFSSLSRVRLGPGQFGRQRPFWHSGARRMASVEQPGSEENQCLTVETKDLYALSRKCVETIVLVRRLLS